MLRRAIYGGVGMRGIAAATYPLDGLSPTGAWSMSRDLLTTFIGGSRYSDTAGEVTSLNDQSGNSRHLTDGGVAGRRPAVTTAGPNSRACASFDGSTDYLTGAALSNFIANNTGYVVVTVMFDAITLNNIGSYTDNCVVGESGGGYMGLFGSNVGSPKRARAYNYDGSEDYASEDVLVEGQFHVMEWRHESGNLYLRVDGGSWSGATVSGNTQVLTGLFRIGFGTGSGFGDIKVIEAATFSTIPASGEQDAIAANFMTWAGV
jgi:hypothetical protein